MEMFQFFSDNIVSLITFVIGIIVTIAVFVLGKKEKRPFFLIRTINLIRSDTRRFSSVTVLHSNKSIASLSVSKIALWNGGKATISGNDIAKKNPVRIDIDKQYEILEAKLLYQKNPANDFNIVISKDRKSIELTFDYFDLNEGVVFQALHTGDENTELYIHGNIKSVKRIVNKKNRKMQSLGNMIDIWEKFSNGYFMRFVLYLIGLFGSAVGALNSDDITLQIISGVLFIFFIAATFIKFQQFIRKLPKGFGVFNEGF